MDGAVGRQAQLIPSGCFILIAFVVEATSSAEAYQQNRDYREQTQQEDKLQKFNNLHLSSLNRCFDRQRASDNEE